MCTYEPDPAQKQTNYFFELWLSEDPSMGRILSGGGYGGYGSTGLLSEETEPLCAKFSKRAEAATSSYSATVSFLQYIYSVLVAKNQ